MIGAVFTCFLSLLGTGGYPKAVQKMVSGKMDIAGGQNTCPNATRPGCTGQPGHRGWHIWESLPRWASV